MKFGVHDGSSWSTIRSSSHRRVVIETELTLAASNWDIIQIGISSVVPEITEVVAEILKTRKMVQPVTVDPTMRLPFAMGYKTPGTLGADRIAAAAGALSFFRNDKPPRSIVVVDAGTAVTLDVISAENVYLGGSIAPGPELLQFALSRGTSQLPSVPWVEPHSPIGTSTEESIQAGIVIPFLEGIRALLLATICELSDAPHVVATGGWGPWLADRIPEIEYVEPSLVLDGIRELVQYQAS